MAKSRIGVPDSEDSGSAGLFADLQLASPSAAVLAGLVEPSSGDADLLGDTFPALSGWAGLDVGRVDIIGDIAATARAAALTVAGLSSADTFSLAAAAASVHDPWRDALHDTNPAAITALTRLGLSPGLDDVRSSWAGLDVGRVDIIGDIAATARAAALTVAGLSSADTFSLAAAAASVHDPWRDALHDTNPAAITALTRLGFPLPDYVLSAGAGMDHGSWFGLEVGGSLASLCALVGSGTVLDRWPWLGVPARGSVDPQVAASRLQRLIRQDPERALREMGRFLKRHIGYKWVDAERAAAATVALLEIDVDEERWADPVEFIAEVRTRVQAYDHVPVLGQKQLRGSRILSIPDTTSHTRMAPLWPDAVPTATEDQVVDRLSPERHPGLVFILSRLSPDEQKVVHARGYTECWPSAAELAGTPELAERVRRKVARARQEHARRSRQLTSDDPHPSGHRHD